jgi:hypothetical protein
MKSNTKEDLLMQEENVGMDQTCTSAFDEYFRKVKLFINSLFFAKKALRPRQLCFISGNNRSDILCNNIYLPPPDCVQYIMYVTTRGNFPSLFLFAGRAE